MKVIDRKKSSTGVVTGKNIITAGLAFTLSAFTTLKPMDKGELVSKKSQSQNNELKIESDAYDMIRKLL